MRRLFSVGLCVFALLAPVALQAQNRGSKPPAGSKPPLGGQRPPQGTPPTGKLPQGPPPSGPPREAPPTGHPTPPTFPIPPHGRG
jgi:hypothetical protein